MQVTFQLTAQSDLGMYQPAEPPEASGIVVLVYMQSSVERDMTVA